nr:GT4 family glycosyltransferase PelF [uncultured Oscillibacter sp.]
MKICIVAEGSYPYVVGGVSTWTHNLIRSFPEHEFTIVSVLADRSQRGKFQFELPENVWEVHELYLNDTDWRNGKRRKTRLNKTEFQALRSLVLNRDVEWEAIFQLFQEKIGSVNDLLMGPDFLKIVTEYYQIYYNQLVFTDFLWMIRSIYLPMFLALQTEVPQADVYHCICTGYAGILGSMGKFFHGGRMLVSEHGIYTREREEELIKAKWVQGIFKNIWIDQFRKMSSLAYEKADTIVSLFEHARGLQIEENCPPEKTRIIPNGIDVERFENLPGKEPEDARWINVGAVVRVAPVKDIMTMIQAFRFAKEREPALRLYIMGPWEEEEDYAKECFELIRIMNIPDIEFTGKVDVREYYGKMDVMLLTSISEGQPLTILESFAARKPVVATDVGNCKGLIMGESDDFGEAGIVVPVMDVAEISMALLRLVHNEADRARMGESGYKRVTSFYRAGAMYDSYRELYKELGPEDSNQEGKEGTEEWRELALS